MKPVSIDSTLQTFRSVLATAIGTTRGLYDGGEECARVFILGQAMIEEIAQTLSYRWNDQYGDEGIELTHESAAVFFEETYPLTDETARGCREF